MAEVANSYTALQHHVTKLRTFFDSSCWGLGVEAALIRASEALFGCPIARPIRPTL